MNVYIAFHHLKRNLISIKMTAMKNNTRMSNERHCEVSHIKVQSDSPDTEMKISTPLSYRYCSFHLHTKKNWIN